MMRKHTSILLMTMALLALLVSNATAVGCFSALKNVIPCQGYLVHGASKPSAVCCKGVEELGKIANKSKGERQALCKCLKSAAQHFPINERKAKALPNLCHAKLNITISPHIDCNKV